MAGKKGRRRSPKAPLADFPIAVFADSPDRMSGGRMKKSQSGSSVREQPVLEEDTPEDWGDREEQEEEQGSSDRVLVTQEPVEKTVSWQPRWREYRVLGEDFWHMLGGLLQPEQVGVFALICRSSYTVTCSRSFWRRLYLRYYRHDLHSHLLPPRLLPSILLHRPRGLRSCVVRALHLLHPPFLARRGGAAGLWPDPSTLIGTRCTVHWTQKVAQKQVFFFFKLRNKFGEERVKRTRERGKEGVEGEEAGCDNFDDEEDGREGRFLEEMGDIMHNSEEGCKVLQVGAAAWARLPPVMGLHLRSVGLSVSGMGMRYHKLSLVFGTELRVTHLVLEPVTSIKVLPWWNPGYPVEGEGANLRPPTLTADHWDS